MKAWVLEGINDLRFEDVPDPSLNMEGDEDKVIIRVKAAGICGSDIPRIFKTGAYHHPLIPGHEFSGEVVKTGAAATGVKEGIRTGIFPLIPCRVCDQCRIREYQRCRNYDYLGSRSDGGFAEYVKVPAGNLLPLPDSVSFEAASMLEPMAVSVHAMRKGIRENDNKEIPVTVIGLGTIGLFLCLFLRERGYRVLGLANRESRKELFTGLGFPESDFYLSDNVEESDSELIFECAGKNEAYEKAVSIAPPGGRIVSVGNPASDMSLKKEVYWKILRNELIISGTWNSSFTGDLFDDWHYVLSRLEKGSFDAGLMISHKLSLPELMDGLLIMKNKSEEYTKITVVP